MQEVFEKIIEKFKDLFPFNTTAGVFISKADAIEIVKQEAEQYNNGWIPCSERLPEVPEGTEDDDCPEFNVTIKGASRAATLRCSSDGTWFDEFGYVYPVIAWQPLPKPYQPKGE